MRGERLPCPLQRIPALTMGCVQGENSKGGAVYEGSPIAKEALLRRKPYCEGSPIAKEALLRRKPYCEGSPGTDGSNGVGSLVLAELFGRA